MAAIYPAEFQILTCQKPYPQVSFSGSKTTEDYTLDWNIMPDINI